MLTFSTASSVPTHPRVVSFGKTTLSNARFGSTQPPPQPDLPELAWGTGTVNALLQRIHRLKTAIQGDVDTLQKGPDAEGSWGEGKDSWGYWMGLVMSDIEGFVRFFKRLIHAELARTRMETPQREKNLLETLSALETLKEQMLWRHFKQERDPYPLTERIIDLNDAATQVNAIEEYFKRQRSKEGSQPEIRVLV